MKFSYANIYPKVVAEIVARIAQLARKKEKIRILEIGAGQGYLTWLVASKLQGLANIEYVFTDIARSFVSKAEKHAIQENIAWMSFGTLDIMADIEAQGYDKYAFDIVMEYDVIHATNDISTALQHIKRLLMPGGVFLSIQAPSVRWTSTMIWGLAEGWWNFAADHFRKHSLTAVLNYEDWEEILRLHGYQNIYIYPEDQARRSYVDRMLIVSQQPSDIEGDDYKEWSRRKQRERVSLLRHKIQHIQNMEKSGLSVILSNKGESWQQTVQRALSDAQKRFGGIHGMFHMAPQTEATPLRATTLAGFTRSFRASLQETFALKDMLTGKALDFILWVFSAGDQDEMHSLMLVLHSFAASFAINTRSGGAGIWTSVRWDLTGDLLNRTVPGTHIDNAEKEKRILAYLLSRNDISSLRVHSHPLAAGTIKSGAVEDQSSEGPASLAVKSSARHLSSRRRPHLQQPYVSPENETEQIIARLWENLLGGFDVGINDNFFELGGESLLATQIVSKLREIFQVEISIRTFFENATIAGLARTIHEAKETHISLQEPEIVALPRSAKRTRQAIK